MTAGRTSRSRPGRRVDPQLAPAFAKDPAEERLLDHLNAILAPYEEEDYLDLEERFPTLHLVGVPRSGTTLLHQAVVSGLEIGYVNNLVAAFWRAPVYGIRLSRKLGIDPSSSSFDSRYGRTRGVGEPHEFGYFWNAHLGYADLSEQPLEHEASIDFAHLARVLRNMAEANGGPMVFKPMLLIWHLEAIRREMPRSCFVWIQRDQRATALSLLGMRRSVFGSVNAWASLRPRISADVPLDTPARQVVAQVLLLDRAIQRGRDR
ncbi:MAG: sulfotransferase, partial [Gaiellales bacterium]